jgi:hypothetical protein
MANVIRAVPTEDGLKFWPQMLGGIIPVRTPLFFKIGEGGWINDGSGPVPRDPVGTLRRGDGIQDLDAVVDVDRGGTLPGPARYPTTSRFTATKTFAVSDITFQAPSTLQLRCILTLAEGNDVPDPEYWEIGIFTDHPDNPGVDDLMVAYGTFPKEIKTAARRLENLVLITMSEA